MMTSESKRLQYEKEIIFLVEVATKTDISQNIDNKNTLIYP